MLERYVSSERIFVIFFSLVNQVWAWVWGHSKLCHETADNDAFCFVCFLSIFSPHLFLLFCRLFLYYRRRPNKTKHIFYCSQLFSFIAFPTPSPTSSDGLLRASSTMWRNQKSGFLFFLPFFFFSFVFGHNPVVCNKSNEWKMTTSSINNVKVKWLLVF